ncbi:hypothetical protein K443DRAFT_14092 [Laccaria amethystina LaAM-08-1]|uniref:Anaphase-promoting complex subunit 4 WD40 domain-containing protein n=1 Tax=Laccaria amethystina LaAM-08-1 TaxID=1095629 RepID=A0A0C9X2D0_9AGAR|nr:hypothetical protein K443DRAFT_14092 [Laccaria amethystina LaAM-08-1]
MTATLGPFEIKVQGEVPAGSTITAISFSPDGKFVALADENGLVTIRRTRGLWAVLRTYRAGKNIRGLVWHPTRLYVLFVGTGAGHLYTIPINQGNDVARCRKVLGFIHCIAVGNNGLNLALGYCEHNRAVVCLVEEPTFDLERPITLLREGEDTPHQVKYVGPDKLLIAYFEHPQFLLIDLKPPHSTIWSMEPPTGSYIGGICLSPSLDHMAVTNLTSGIDFYDILGGKFVTTAPFNPLAPTGCNRLVGVVYANEDIVVAGHTNGDAVGVLTNDLEAPQMFKTNYTRNTALPCLRIAHGIADGTSYRL